MTETPTVDSASTFSGPEKAHSPLFLSSSHQNGIWSTLRQEGQPYFQGIGSAKQGSNTALGLGCQSRSLDSKMQHAGTLNEEQLRSLWLKERKNKQTNKTIRTLLFFFPPPIRTGKFKLESKLCLWASQLWTAVWNKIQSICCLVRLHVPLWIHEHYYGIYLVMLARKSICVRVFVKGSPVLCWSCQHPHDFWSSACSLDSLL